MQRRGTSALCLRRKTLLRRKSSLPPDGMRQGLPGLMLGPVQPYKCPCPRGCCNCASSRTFHFMRVLYNELYPRETKGVLRAQQVPNG